MPGIGSLGSYCCTSESTLKLGILSWEQHYSFWNSFVTVCCLYRHGNQKNRSGVFSCLRLLDASETFFKQQLKKTERNLIFATQERHLEATFYHTLVSSRASFVSCLLNKANTVGNLLWKEDLRAGWQYLMPVLHKMVCLLLIGSCAMCICRYLHSNMHIQTKKFLHAADHVSSTCFCYCGDELRWRNRSLQKVNQESFISLFLFPPPVDPVSQEGTIPCLPSLFHPGCRRMWSEVEKRRSQPSRSCSPTVF